MLTSRLLYSLPPFLTAGLLIGLAWVSWARARRTRTNRLFALLCLIGGLLYVDILINFRVAEARTALMSSRIGHILYPFLIPLWIHFFHAFLGIEKRRWLVGLAYVYALLVAALSLNGGTIAGVRLHSFGYFGIAGKYCGLMAGGSALVTLYNLILIFSAIRREQRSIQKNKLKYVFIGFGALGVLSSLNFLTLYGLPVYPPGVFGFIPMAVFAAGVFKYDLLDMGLLIRKGLLYSILTACMTALYALVIVAAQARYEAMGRSDSFLFPLILFLLITFMFGPIKSRVQRVIDRPFARGRADYRKTIKQVSSSIASLRDTAQIKTLLQNTIVEAMQVKRCQLFLVRQEPNRGEAIGGNRHNGLCEAAGLIEADPLLACFFENQRHTIVKMRLMGAARQPLDEKVLAALNHLDAEIAIPLHFMGRLNGLMVIGEKRSGEMFASEDIDLLETLCHQSALALENARAFEALQELTRTLESKVAERTRDLQAALEEKERTQEQLIRSESLAALGQLVAGVAHELNNPLASVTSLLQSAVEELCAWEPATPMDEDLLDDLRFADRELARAKGIVASLLGLARQTQTYEEAVDLNIVVRDALRVLFNQYKHSDLEVIEAFEDDLPTVQGNFANLGQVAINIIQNAIQATAEKTGGGGRLVLRTAFDAKSKSAMFSCEDNGPGIPQDLRQDIFKPFFTTKPVGKGTGLGLYICHEIIRRHGGTISLEAAEPRGAVFRVVLPVSTS